MQTIYQPQENRPNANQIVQPNLQPKQPPLMKIKYKKKKLLFESLPGLFWTGIAIDGIIGVEDVRWSKYVILLLGLSYLGTFIFHITYQFVTLKNDIIHQNGFFGNHKKIKLTDIIQIKEFDGDYVLVTENTELKIYTEELDTKSFNELITILSKLDLPATKTPFSNENN